ncbi:helix-turn-helix domain-containing protein [Micromonospora sp. WMMD812]|uniref:helix-turn-helix domain-containing protein n=1 Tax=Micromonospora sp. WMMD812 TaxID=3015152 RepID=UPI00248C05AE|nr:helix-turn-helix domain-containing protein [Micromonospora sp. WMMD812]WBB70554.1 LuxR C-terminal-related transcriptional regulator [Micromonospora sp. WMMD812]
MSEPEERVYEALTRRRQATRADLVDDVALSQAQLSRTLGRLVDRGLASRLPGRPTRYAATPPDQVATSLIAERERDLLRLRTHADHLAKEIRRRDGTGRHPAELVEVVEGAANLRATLVRLQREAQVQIRGLDRGPYLDNPVTGNSEETHQLADRGLTYRVIYDRSALDIPGRMAEIWRGIQSGERARVASDVPMKLVLCDDRYALVPVMADGPLADAAYLVHPSSLLDAFSELFEALWARAVAINRSDVVGRNGTADRAGTGDRAAEDHPDRLSDRDIELIGLLAGGATDERIARTLGLSVRTVHRQVHRIMTMVGAETRFQAGMEAVRRGWV